MVPNIACAVCVMCLFVVVSISTTGVMNKQLNLRTPSEVLPTCSTHETASISDPRVRADVALFSCEHILDVAGPPELLWCLDVKCGMCGLLVDVADLCMYLAWRRLRMLKLSFYRAGNACVETKWRPELKAAPKLLDLACHACMLHHAGGPAHSLLLHAVHAHSCRDHQQGAHHPHTNLKSAGAPHHVPTHHHHQA